MASPVHVLGFAGSLRQQSFNRSALVAASELLPADMTLEVFDLAPLPMFNQDLEGNPPDAVVQFKERIAAADALLIATPEYNYTIPAPLTNALAWASRTRPLPSSPLNGKPAAIMGAGGRMGTSRAQYHLRQSCLFLNLLLVNRPEVCIMAAQDKFDPAGRLTDEPTRKLIAELLTNLGDWTRRLRGQ